MMLLHFLLVQLLRFLMFPQQVPLMTLLMMQLLLLLKKLMRQELWSLYHSGQTRLRLPEVRGGSERTSSP